MRVRTGLASTSQKDHRSGSLRRKGRAPRRVLVRRQTADSSVMNNIEQFTIDIAGGSARVHGSAAYAQRREFPMAPRGVPAASLLFDIRLRSERDLLTLAGLLNSPDHGNTLLWCSGTVTDGRSTDSVSALRSRTSPLTQSRGTPNVWLEYIERVPSDCEPRDAYASAFLDLEPAVAERLAGNLRRATQSAAAGQ